MDLSEGYNDPVLHLKSKTKIKPRTTKHHTLVYASQFLNSYNLTLYFYLGETSNIFWFLCTTSRSLSLEGVTSCTLQPQQ